MAKKPVKLEKKLFETFDEAAISYSKVGGKQIALLKALVESYNSKFGTRFYMDTKRNEIVHAGIIKEASYSQFAKLINLLEKKNLSVSLTESKASYKSAFTKLMESELEQAEIILAAQSISDRLQKMAEDLAQMVSEDVLPISDQMKSVFGTDYAERWAQVTKESLESAFETVSSTKDAVSDATRVLERNLEGDPASASDMAKSDVGGDDLDLDGDDLGGDLDSDDLLGGSEPSSGPEDEPLGRAKKESREYLKKKLSESVNLLVGGRDFDEVESYKGFTLGATDHDDGDVRKVDYCVYKLQKEEGAEGLPRPQRKYKKIKSLSIAPYAKEHEAVSEFKKIVDSGNLAEAFGTPASEPKPAFGKRKPAEPVGADGDVRISTKKHSFSYEHSGSNVFILRDGGTMAKDRYRLPYIEAMEFIKDMRQSKPAEQQKIMARYFSQSIFDKPKMTPESALDDFKRDMNHSHQKAKRDIGIMNKAMGDEPYNYDIEGSSIVIRKGHSSMAPNSTRTLSPQESLDFIKELKSIDPSEHQRLMAEYYNLAHGVYEHEEPEPYLKKIKNKGYDVKYTREKNGAIYFAISKKNDFDEFTSDNEVLHVIEPRTGEYIINMDYKAKFKSLEDAVDYHFEDSKLREGEKSDLKKMAALLGKSIVGKKMSASGLSGVINKAAADSKEEDVKEGGIPASVIKSKTRYAEMSDEELAKTFTNKSEEELRQMAWRHGYGKMSDHYVKRVAKGAKTEANPFTYAAKKAKEQGKDEFELDGKTFKVEEDSDLAQRAIDTMKAGKNNQPQKRVNPQDKRAIDDLSNAMNRDPKLKKAMGDLVGEGKWEYPDELKSGKNAPSLRKKRKSFRKAQKAQAHHDLMTGKISNKPEEDLDEALATIREDIIMGIPQPKAIKNAAMMFGISDIELTETWMAHKK